MIRPDCAFAYSQARLQARLGVRAGAADWQRLNATRDLGALLQASASSALASWTRELTARVGVHDAERSLRRAWLQAVDEVVAWQPPRWRAAVAWLRWLPYLPALEKLARGAAPPDWMRGDPLLGPIVAEDPRQRAASVQRTGYAPLAAGFHSPPDVTGAWLRHWRELWPRDDPGAIGLARVARDVGHARTEVENAPPGANTGAALVRLEKRLLAAFRRNPLTVVATVAWLALAGLDLLQLRGSVATRALRLDRGYGT